MDGPRLMDEVRRLLRLHQYSFSTEKTYVQWIRRFIVFHGKRHPREMGAAEIEAFLSHLAVARRVSASTRNQALNALLFLYRKVLDQDLPWMDEMVRAQRPHRVPVVLSQAQVARVLDAMRGPYWLMVSLLYGSGLRQMECLRLRIKDIDFDYLQVTVRDGKGKKDRRTMLAESLAPHVRKQTQFVRSVFDNDRRKGRAGVSIPFAIDTKFREAPQQWSWQYLFRRHGEHSFGPCAARWTPCSN